MPKDFQKIITINLPIYVRKKANGVYEARFRSHGCNICVSSTDYDKLKPKFILKLANFTLPQQKTANVEVIAPQAALFTETAERWLGLKRPTIKTATYNYYVQLLTANIFPVFQSVELKNVKQSDVQILINDYIKQDKMRTATKIYQTLKAIFDFAVGEDLIEKSPMRLLKPPKYEEKNGCAFTLKEEREFMRKLRESNCISDVKHALIFLLYTGIRRSELASANIEGEFISVICAKTRKGFQEKRRLIPITPMLLKHLADFDVKRLNALRPDALTQALKRLMPEHHLHELRHTFITRCQECSVAREVVSVWAGHAADNTQTSNVYTHFSREFMLKESKKVIYNL